MTTTPNATDYLMIGAGATSLAFVDSLVAHTAATVLIVDAHDAPGGHWNDAYPFVRLHQPSVYYGVDSLPLGTGGRDVAGRNAGMDELASGAEVRSYFDRVLRDGLLSTGQVTYLPRHWAEVRDDGTAQIRSLVTGTTREVRAGMIVDGTLAGTEVPSTHPPRYTVAEGVTCVPINALPTAARPGARYTVVGSGKTGIDAVLWLLDHEVDPDRIRWIVPRDAWMLDRGNVQMAPDRFERVIGGMIAQLDAIALATSAADCFLRVEAAGQLVRLDTEVEPTAYKCCTVSSGELSALRRVANVIRLGYVRSVGPDAIELTHGTVPLDPREIIIDCSASALQTPPQVPVFAERRINLQMIRTCQPTFSGAMIGVIAASEPDVARRNALAHPVNGPDVPLDWLRMWGESIRNRVAWAQHPTVSAWLARTRLDPIAIMARTVRPDESAKLAMLGRLRDAMGQAGARIPALLASAN